MSGQIKRREFMTVSASTLAAGALVLPALGATQPRPKKKIVEYGWDCPDPAFIRDNIRTMETRPFDGVIFRITNRDHIFDTRTWKESDIESTLDVLADIKWDTFTDNFPMLRSTNSWGMNFFNDDHWNTITSNMKLVSRMAKVGRCTGICFDTEPYHGKNPWLYNTEVYGKRSFDEVVAQVRKRGAQFITALQSSLPNLTLLSFFLLGFFPLIAGEADVKGRQKLLMADTYALFPAFFNGMLEAAGPGVRFIDGHEDAYYFKFPDHYYDAVQLIKQRCQSLVPEELRHAYVNQVQVGMPLYVEELLANSNIHIPKTADYLRYDERLRLLEHNMYYALTTSDEYVWVYNQEMNWWKDSEPGAKPSTQGGIPPGLENAIVSACRKYERGMPLGYDVERIVSKGFYAMIKDMPLGYDIGHIIREGLERKHR